jgi:transcriptional regulator with XRE-family HTH domain
LTLQWTIFCTNLEAKPARDCVSLPPRSLHGSIQNSVYEFWTESLRTCPFSNADAFDPKLSLYLREIVGHDTFQITLVHKIWSRVHKMSTRMKKPAAVGSDVLPDQDAAHVLDRFKDALDLRTDTDLASILGISKSTLSNWRLRNSIPLNKLRKACKKYGIPMDFLLTGNLISDRNNSAILDTKVLGYIFRLLDRYGMIRLPQSDDPGFDPAIRAAAEFLDLQSQTRLLIEQLSADGKLDQEGVTRTVVEKLKGLGPQ